PTVSADNRMLVLRAADPPGTYGANRSTSGRRRNQRTRLRNTGEPPNSPSAANAKSCAGFTAPPRPHLLEEDPLLFRQHEEPAGPDPARHHRGAADHDQGLTQ